MVRVPRRIAAQRLPALSATPVRSPHLLACLLDWAMSIPLISERELDLTPQFCYPTVDPANYRLNFETVCHGHGGEVLLRFKLLPRYIVTESPFQLPLLSVVLEGKADIR